MPVNIYTCTSAIFLLIILIFSLSLSPNFYSKEFPDLSMIFTKFCSRLGLVKSIAKITKRTMVRYLNQEDSIKIDQELFNEYKFSLDQLMELAGLSVAVAIAKTFEHLKEENSKILIVAGPGNNGGDGFVAARHLKLFGFRNISILSAKKPTKDLFVNLITQAEGNDIEISYDPKQFKNDPSIGLIVDGLFGFSFKPPIRPDYLPFMDILTSAKVPIAAIDNPSGWDIENGPVLQNSLSNTLNDGILISLTAPKLCAKFFKGPHHYLGGRFVPAKLANKYSLDLPEYPATDLIVKL